MRRVGLDVFNVFNHPNNPAPSTMDDGILLTRDSGGPARVMQLGARLSW